MRRILSLLLIAQLGAFSFALQSHLTHVRQPCLKSFDILYAGKDDIEGPGCQVDYFHPDCDDASIIERCGNKVFDFFPKKRLRKRFLTVAAALMMSRASSVGAVSRRSQAQMVDFSDETAYTGHKKIKKNTKAANVIFIATIPLSVKLAIEKSKGRQQREMVGPFLFLLEDYCLF